MIRNVLFASYYEIETVQMFPEPVLSALKERIQRWQNPETKTLILGIQGPQGSGKVSNQFPF